MASLTASREGSKRGFNYEQTHSPYQKEDQSSALTSGTPTRTRFSGQDNSITLENDRETINIHEQPLRSPKNNGKAVGVTPSVAKSALKETVPGMIPRDDSSLGAEDSSSDNGNQNLRDLVEL